MTLLNHSGRTGANGQARDRGANAALPGRVKPWGRWATFGLGLIALLIGQLAALTALIWWSGLASHRFPM